MTAPAGAQNGKVVIDPTLYDLNRVEVLRGPQGYAARLGRPMGGTVKLVTNQPNLTLTQGNFESLLSGTDGGGFNHNDNFMFNLPLDQRSTGDPHRRLYRRLTPAVGFDPDCRQPVPPSRPTAAPPRGDVQAAPLRQSVRSRIER